MDQFELELVEEFVIEGSELIEEFHSYLNVLKDGEFSHKLYNDMFRVAHNLKGSAYSIGLEDLGNVVHKLENLLSALRSNELKIDSDLLTVLFAAHDYIEDYFTALSSNSDEKPDAINLTQKLSGFLETRSGRQIKNIDEKIEEIVGDSDIKDQAVSYDVLNRLRPKNVLIIDDEMGIREILSEIVSEEGYQVFEAENGETGLQEFSKNAIDLILLDLKMPNLNGVEFLKKVRSIDKKVGVVIVSGMSTSEDLQEILNLGADGFIGKPFTVEQVVSKVNQTLKVRLLRQVIEQLSLSTYKAYMIIGTILSDPTLAEMPGIQDKSAKLKRHMDEIAVFTTASLSI